MSGCAIGAKWSTMYTEVPNAEKTGNYEIRPESMVLRINHDKSGKVTGVVYADKNGVTHEQKAKVVCVAGNSIDLLVCSKFRISMFKDGMANSSGKLEETMAHLTGAVYAMMPGEVNLHRGTQMAGIIRDEQKHDPRRGFAAGYELETLPAFGLWGFATYAKPGGWGRQYASDIENYRNVAGLWIVGEDMPQESNRITLHDTKKDQYGLPIPSVTTKIIQMIQL